MWNCILQALSLVAALAAAWHSPARAQAATEPYKGKTLKFVVGFGTGGGFDAYARMIAPPLGRALDATVVVENQPGAGGIIALNRIAAGPADGLSLMIVDGTPAALGQLLGQENVRYDLTKLDHLGMISATRFAFLVPMASNLKSMTDAGAMRSRVLFGSSGPTDGPTGSAAFFCEALAIQCRVILGYKGSNDMILAMQRGEVDANFLSDSTAATLVRSRQARAIGVAARTRSPLLPDVSTVFEQFELDPNQQWLLDYRANLNDLGRILVAAPGTEPVRLAALRSALRQVLTDPAVVDDGLKTSRVVDYQPPEVPAAKAADVLSGITAEQRERIRHIALKKYLE
jgi:tripartite-type tricarboxylate transporter receptor subunit TctC